MIFNSPELIFFVAFGLFFFSLAPVWARKYGLLVLCILWYGSWRPAWPLLLLGMAALNYAALKLRKRDWVYFSLIAADTGFLVCLKALPSLATHLPHVLNRWIGSETPFGTSFFCFLLMAFVFDHWRGVIREAECSLTDVLLYVSFFPALVGGPIERYNRLSAQLRRLGPIAFDNLVDGAVIFSYGFIKKTFIGVSLGDPASVLLTHPVGFTNMIVGGFLATFQAYADFSGYCDMGRGIARCFGVRLEANFRPFYYSRNPNEFWQRWNITLGTWIRDYFSFPLLLRFGRRMNRYVVILLAFAIVGLWHGVELHWILFGVFDGVLIVLYFAAQNGLFRQHPRLVSALGFALAFCLYVGNGVLQNSSSIGMLGDFFRHPEFGNVLGDLRGMWLGRASFIPALAALIAADYCQEKTGNADFFLEIPRLGRIAAAAGLASWFLVLLHGGSFIELTELPPLYFRL